MPVRRVTPTHSRPLKRARNIIPVHPRNNHEDSQAPGPPDSHTTSGSPIAPPHGMRFVISSQCPLMRFPGLTRPHEEADNPRYRSPSDLFHSQCCNIPGIDALPTYDRNLWQRTQMTSEEFKEFKEHLRRINALIFSWLVTIYRLILFFTWYTTVCAFSVSYRPLSHHPEGFHFPAFRCQGFKDSMGPPRWDYGVNGEVEYVHWFLFRLSHTRAGVTP